MKHMKLIALLAAAMMVQSVYAGKKIGVVKKMADVSWHVAEVLVGYNLMREWRQETDLHRMPGYRKTGSVLLLVDGLSGLNKELRIIDRFRRKK